MSDSAPATSASRWPLWAACLVYLALRALVLATNFDAVSLPNYELMGPGNLAKVLSEGWDGVPLVQHYDNCGAQIIVGYLAAPFYALLDGSYLALKIVPVLLGLATLLLIWWILGRCLSRRAAIIAVFLFALTPPTLVKYSMIAKANHFENLPFQLAAWALFLHAHAGGFTRWKSFAWAFAAGLAVFVSLDCVFLVATLALMQLALRGTRATLKDLAVLAPGFLAGLSPLVAIQFAAAGRVTDFVAISVAGGEGGAVARFFRRMFEFWTETLPSASVFEDFGPLTRQMFDGLYLTVFLLAWAALAFVFVRAWRTRGRDELAPAEPPRRSPWLWAPLVLYFPLFSLGFSASARDFNVYQPPVEVGGYRYLVPHFLFATLTIAAASAHWISRGGARRLAGIALAALAFATSLGTLPIVDWRGEHIGSAVKHPGYDFDYYCNLMLRDQLWTPEKGEVAPYAERLARYVEGFSPEADNPVWFGIAGRVGQVELTRPGLAGAAGSDPGPLLRLIDLDAAHTIDLARGVGSALRRIALVNREKFKSHTQWLETLQAQGDPRIEFVVEGLCQPFGLRLEIQTASDLQFDRELRLHMPAACIPAFVRGQGQACGRLWRRGIDSDVVLVQSILDALPPEDGPEFWFGFGTALAEEGWSARTLRSVNDVLAKAPHTELLAGFGAGARHVFGSEGAREIAKELLQLSTPEDRAALERGLAWPGYPAPFAR